MQSRLKILALGAAISAAVPLSGFAATARPGVDGVFRGTSHLVAGSDASCQSGMPMSVKVTGGQFYFAWRPRQGAEVRIASDGGYSALLRGTPADAEKHMLVLPRIDGDDNGQTLVGDYGTRWCDYTYRLSRN
jgi:hypothetical protein